MKTKFFLIIHWVLISSIFSAPINEEPLFCAETCSSDAKYISYEVGNTYVYQYNSLTAININDKRLQNVDIKARLEISSDFPCELYLQLRQVRINGVENSYELTQQLEANALKFGWSDGKIVGVCPSLNDTLWSVNVKKAILSALQMSANSIISQTTVTEKDILGECETVYRPNANLGNTIKIQKTKSINNCKQRQNSFVGSYGLNQFITRNENLIKSDVDCVQVLENSIVKTVKCDEVQHMMSLMTNSESAVISTQINIKFVNKESQVLNAYNRHFVSQDLLWTANQEVMSDKSDKTQIYSLVNEMCAQLEQQMFSPKLVKTFNELLVEMKSLSKTSLKQVEEKIKSGEVCNSHKLQHMFNKASGVWERSGADSSEESDRVRQLYMQSIMGLFSKPSEQQLEYMLTLLNPETSSNQQILLISSVIQNYCEDVSNCDSIAMISQTIEWLIQRLKYSSNSVHMLSTVKALENFNIKTHEIAVEVLTNLAKSELIEDEIRVAAMNALKYAINDDICDTFAEIFKHNANSIEVRITAYKTVVMSGFATDQRINEFLQNSDQNLSQYVRSHLKNLKNSQNSYLLPDNMPNTIESNNNNNNNLFMTSTNLRLEYNNIDINLDIIYEKPLQIPRTLNIKTSVPVLGKELPLVELTIRQKGLDKHLKNILHKTANNVPLMYKELIDLLSNHNSVDSENENFIQILITIANKNIFVFDSRDVNTKCQLQLNAVLNHILNSLQQNLSIDRLFAANFLNYKIQIPTISGIPVNIDLMGTALASLKAQFNYQINSQTNLIERLINPSIAAELSVKMYLKTDNTENGIEYQTRVYSSPVIDYSLELKENRIFNAKLNFPDDKQTLFEIETELNSKSKQFVKTLRKSNHYCSHLSKTLGISICSELTFSDSPKSSQMQIYVTKHDKTMKSVDFTVITPTNNWNENKLWKISLDTPNSKIDRKMSLELEISNPFLNKRSFITVVMQTPWKKMSGLGSLNTEENDRSLKFDVVDNGVSQISFDASLQKRSNGHESELKPKLKFEAWGQKHIDLDGSVYLPEDPHSNEVESSASRRRREAQSGNELDADSNGKVIATNFNVRVFALDANIKAAYDVSKREATVSVEYNVESLPKETLQLTGRFERTDSQPISRRAVTASVTSSQFPEYNSRLAYGRNIENGRTRDIDVLLLWNENLSDRLHINRSLAIGSDEHVGDLQYRLLVEATPLDIHYELSLHGYHDNRQDSADREYNLQVSGRDLTQNNNANQFEAEINIKAQKHEMQDRSTHRLINTTFTLSGPLVDNNPQLYRFTRINTEIDYTSDRRLQVRLRSPLRLLIATLSKERTNQTLVLNLQVTQTKDGQTQRLLSASGNLRRDKNRGFRNNIEVDYIYENQPQRIEIFEVLDYELQGKRINLTALASIEYTQFPWRNKKFSYTLVGEARKQIEDELLIAWGEKWANKVQLQREINSTRTELNVEVNETSTVIVTPLDIDYQVNEHVSVSLSPEGSVTNFHFHIDRRDRTGRNAKSEYSAGVDFERTPGADGSQGVLNASLRFPAKNEEYIYRRTWNHENPKERFGKIYVQWAKARYANIDYNLKVQQKVLKRKDRQTDVDVLIRYSGYTREAPREVRGVINYYVVGDKKQVKINLESTSGAYLKGDVITKGERSSRKEFSITYDVSLFKPSVVNVKVAGKERYVPKSLVLNELSVDYQFGSGRRESLKYLSRAQSVMSYTLVNITAQNEFKWTQYPQKNYEFDFQSLYRLHQRYLQNELSIAWGENLVDNRVHVYHDNQDSATQNKQKTGKSQLKIHAKPLGVEYEFETNSSSTRGDDQSIVQYRSETIGTNIATGNKGIKSVLEYDNVDGVKTARIYLKLKSPQRQWSRITNLTLVANENRLDEILLNYRMRNNRTNRYINLDADLYRNRPSVVRLKVPEFDYTGRRTREPNDVRHIEAEIVGKENFPYKYQADIRIDPRDRTVAYKSQVDRLVTPKGSTNELVAAVYSQLLYKTNINYAYRRRLSVAVDTNTYQHQTQLEYANFPESTLQSSTSRSGQNLLNVTSSLSRELAFRLDALSPDVRVLFELDPRRRIVNFDIQDP